MIVLCFHWLPDVVRRGKKNCDLRSAVVSRFTNRPTCGWFLLRYGSTFPPQML